MTQPEWAKRYRALTEADRGPAIEDIQEKASKGPSRMSYPNERAIEAKEELVAEGLPVSKPPKTVQIGNVGNLFQQNPVVINAIVTLVVLIGTVWGTDLDPAQVGTIVGAVFTIGSFVARQMVTPVPKAEAGIQSAYLADPTKDAKPVL